MPYIDTGPSLKEVSDLLKPCPQQWWIAGGWAIDGFLGGVTRKHGDVDVAILQREEAALRSYLDSQGIEVWPGLGNGQALDSPIHPGEQLPSGTKVLLCRTSPKDDWSFECLINKTDENEWVFFNDDRVRRPLTEIGFVGQDDIPYLNPEIVLLYKAKNRRDKDEYDFTLAAPRLSKQARSWLAVSVGIVHPDHSWPSHLGQLG